MYKQLIIYHNDIFIDLFLSLKKNMLLTKKIIEYLVNMKYCEGLRYYKALRNCTEEVIYKKIFTNACIYSRIFTVEDEKIYLCEKHKTTTRPARPNSKITSIVLKYV